MTDWKPGDIALCVKGGKICNAPRRAPDYPVSGNFYTVERVGSDFFYEGVEQALWLKDGPENVDGQRAWVSYRFVKVTPPEADEFDKEVIDLYNKKEIPNNAPKPKRVATTI